MAPPIAGDLSTLGRDNKVHLPKAVLAATGWDLQEGPPVLLVAELLDVGRVRLHMETDVRPRIDELLKAAESIETTAVIHDRYRTVQLYTAKSDFRVRLVPIVVMFLSIAPEDNRTVYVEGRSELVDIFSLKARHSRLEDLSGVSSI